MEERIPVGIYPFQAELLPIIRRFDQLQQTYRLKKVFSFPGSGLVGKDVAYACNQPEIGVEVESFNSNNLEGVESLILVNPLQNSEKTDENLISASITSLQHGTSVILCCNRTDSIVESANKLKTTFPGFTFSFDATSSQKSALGDEMYYKRLDVPVILVGSLVENPDTLETICYLFENFSKIDVKCLVFCKTPAGELLGFKSVSPIVGIKEFTESTKVEEMNRYANNLIFQNNPGLVIVEAPDAVIRFSNITPNGFGILSYMMSQAFQPDHFICSIPFELTVPEMINALSKDFDIRLGTPITAALASNIVVDSVENLQFHAMSYVFVPTSHSQSKLSQEKVDDSIPVYTTADKNDLGLFSYLCELFGLNLVRS